MWGEFQLRPLTDILILCMLDNFACFFCGLQIESYNCVFSDYGKELEQDVIGDTSGHYKRILVSCLQANREESKEFDRNKARQDAQALHEAGEKKWGTDESRYSLTFRFL